VSPLACTSQSRRRIASRSSPARTPPSPCETMRCAVQYARLAAANFTTVLGNFGASDVSSVKMQLAAYAATGLDAIVSTCEA
jgi:hypothetical protein